MTAWAWLFARRREGVPQPRLPRLAKGPCTGREACSHPPREALYQAIRKSRLFRGVLRHHADGHRVAPRYFGHGWTMTLAGGGTLFAAAHVSGEVVPARAQMATTLAFHIILACLGIALPALVLLAEFVGLRRSDEAAMRLARRWSQAMGVLVAVGAVTGTVLSFEMGLLWPGLMRRYGAVLGLPFGVEGLFFFLEAIFTAIYLYGWRRLPGWAHWWTGVPNAISG